MTTELFVARDRARRLGYRLEKVLQERRLAWRGAEIGMATLSDDADRALAEIAGDARQSVEAVLSGDLRDRERGFMEVPFAVAMTSVAYRVETAAALEAGRRLRQVKEAEAKRRVIEELSGALARLEAFQAAYDAKTPVPEARPVDLAHLLTRLAPAGQRPYDRPPPPFVTDAHALEDLLLASRATLPEDGAWRVTPAAPARPLTLSLGCEDGREDAVDAPEEVERAARVLAFRHPVAVEALATPGADGAPRLCGLRLRLGDAEGENLEAAVAAATGGEARLSADAERAVRALTAAPPAGAAGLVPPERLVALLGVLQVLDAEMRALLVPRVNTPAVRRGALELPREKTRKAPLRPALLADLEAEFESLATRRLSALAADLGKSRWSPSSLDCGDAAVLLAAFGRDVARGAIRLERRMDLRPLTDDEVAALAQSLADVATVRRDLEAGRTVRPEALTRLECGAIAALGRLGRLAGRQDDPST